MSSKETLEQFGSCWEGLEDPRSGNAAAWSFYIFRINRKKMLDCVDKICFICDDETKGDS